MKKGFTLIELLVVVLIIAILSSLALPKYTKAVEKARASEALIQMNALTQAIDVFVLNKGFKDISQTELTKRLDIEIPYSENLMLDFRCYSYECYVKLTQRSGNWQLYAYRYKGNDNEEWQKSCHFNTKSGRSVCNGMRAEGYSEWGSFW